MISPVLPPGSTVGIIGGGQLGRMTALAAATLGYKCHIFCPENESPASLISNAATIAPYDDQNSLEVFANTIDVATFEFENIPVETIKFLESKVPTHPNSKSLEISQDRLIEKNFISSTASIAKFCQVNDQDSLELAIKKIGLPAVLKTRRFGYDGKGQLIINSQEDAVNALKKVPSQKLILESLIDIDRELSVIVARGINGIISSYPPVENRHSNNILRLTHAPAKLSAREILAVTKIAENICLKLELIGLLAVEFFITKTGELLVNEIAPRPHNSGHWTMNGCITSQFEQHIRAICGLPLGTVDLTHDVAMENLLGDDINKWQTIVAEPNAKLHLYGKATPRAGRKMGHVNRVYPKGTLKF